MDIVKVENEAMVRLITIREASMSLLFLLPVYLLVIEVGLRTKHLCITNKKKEPDARPKFVLVSPLKTPKPAGFGASIVLVSTIVLPVTFVPYRLITNFKKVEYPGN